LKAGQKRLVLWPESGVPDYVRDGYPAWYYQYTFGGDPWLARWRLARTIGEGGLLLTGTVDLDLVGRNATGGRMSLPASMNMAILPPITPRLIWCLWRIPAPASVAQDDRA
jgi:apolipoprotein N-acyltransferase